jgi:mannose-6-phosphate isomerase-like protein (cupin superfamily)
LPKDEASNTHRGDMLLATENECTSIPLGMKHQLENLSKVPLETI